MKESNTSVRSSNCAEQRLLNPLVVGSNPTGRAKLTTKINSVFLWTTTGILGFCSSIVVGGVVSWNVLLWMAMNWEPEATFVHKILYELF